MKNLYENLCFALTLVFAGSTFASEHPVYSDARAELEVPTVKVDGIPGVYQDISMKFEDGDTLRMLSVKEGVLLNHINKVDIVQTSTFPVQVFLEIRGDFPTGCGEIGQIHQTVADNIFNVHVYFENDQWLENPSLVPCTLAMRPFKEVIALNVYGLEAGIYEYTLNEKFSGSFTLATDNSIDALHTERHPTYSEEDSTLVLPSINLNNKPGHYQEAELELIQDNLWQLRDVKEGKLNQDIQRVDLVQPASFPAQAFLKISGEFTHGCAREGLVQSQMVDNRIIVSAYYENNIWTETPEIVLCTAVMQAFSFNYPINVYGLPAGEYEYEVNGNFTGSFTITEDNVLPSFGPAW